MPPSISPHGRGRSHTSDLRRRGFLGLAGGTLLATAATAQAASQPNPSLDLDIVADFGAKGDGRHDDTAAFRRMHAAALRAQAADPDVQINLRLPSGRTFLYSWNRWTWGLHYLSVTAYGARIQCISDSLWDVDKFPLVTNRGFFESYGYDEAPADPDPNDLGWLIRTAAAGDNAVILKSPADAARLRVGELLLLYSYSQQQYGLPPNARFFERARIAAIAGAVVHLDRKLRFAHRADNPHVPGYAYSPARARIKVISRRDVPLGVRHRYAGLTTLASPHARGGAGTWDQTVHSWLQATGVLETELVDCDLRGLSMGQGGSCVVRNCTSAYNEPDKLIDFVRYEGCRVGSLQSCAGVGDVVFVETSFDQAASCMARTSRFERCRFNGAMREDEVCGLTLYGPQAIRSVTIRDSDFYGRGVAGRTAIGGLEPLPELVVGRDVQLQNGVLRVPLATADDSIGTVMVNGLDVGSMMTIDGTNGGSGRITEIWGDGRHACLRVAFSQAVRNGQTLRLHLVTSVVATGCRLHHVDRGEVAAARFSWNSG